MTLKHIAACLIAVALAMPAAASESDDLALMENVLLGDKAHEALKNQVAEAFVRTATKYLVGKSVRIRDKEAFAAALPERFLSHYVGMQRRAVQACLKDLPPEALKSAAEFVRKSEEMEAAFQKTAAATIGEKPPLGSLEQLPDTLEALAEVLGEGRLENVLLVTLRCASLQEDVSKELQNAAHFQENADVSAVVDVLETPGMASFPNRIIKRDILEELRGTTRR